MAMTRCFLVLAVERIEGVQQPCVRGRGGDAEGGRGEGAGARRGQRGEGRGG